MIRLRYVISQKANLRAVAIRDPQVHVSIVVPIDEAECPTVVREIEMARGRYIGKTGTSRIEVETMWLAAAKGMASLDQPQQCC